MHLEIRYFARSLPAGLLRETSALLALVLYPDAPHNRRPAIPSALPHKKLYRLGK